MTWRAAVPARRYPSWASFTFPAGFPDSSGLVAFGADLSPGSVLGAYRKGIFPWPAPDEYARDINEFRYEDQVSDGVIGLVGHPDDDPYRVAWWSPDPRPVIRAVHLGRNVRKQLRNDRHVTTANTAFRRVAQECRADREPRWLTDRLLDTMITLHEAGWAHSIEVWLDGELAGGAFGLGTGVVLSGDSMFSRRPEAARIAVADMAARFAAAGGTLIDVQWDSPFLRSLGAEPVPRAEYLPVLTASAARCALPPDPLPARRLLAPRLLASRYWPRATGLALLASCSLGEYVGNGSRLAAKEVTEQGVDTGEEACLRGLVHADGKAHHGRRLARGDVGGDPGVGV